MPAYTLAGVQAALLPGQPDTLTAAGALFAEVQTLLGDLITTIPRAVDDATAGVNPPWAGPAATVFRDVIKDLITFLGEVEPMLDPYQPQLGNGATALTTAKSNLDTLVTSLTIPVDAAAADLAAQQILETLAQEYRQIIDRLGPLAASPEALAAIRARSGHDEVDLPVTFLAGYTPTLVGRPPTGDLTAGYLPPTPINRVPDPIVMPHGTSLQSVVPQHHVGGIGSGLGGGTGGGLGNGLSNGLGGGRFGVNPVTHLTTVTRRIAGLGAEPTLPGRMTVPGSAAPPLPGRGVIRPHEEEADEREVTLVGDDDWTDGRGLPGALGRTPSTVDGGGQ